MNMHPEPVLLLFLFLLIKEEDFSHIFRYLPAIPFGSHFVHIFYSSLPRVLFFLFSNLQIFCSKKVRFFMLSCSPSPDIFFSYSFRYFHVVRFGSNFVHIFYSLLPRVFSPFLEFPNIYQKNLMFSMIFLLRYLPAV